MFQDFISVYREHSLSGLSSLT